VGSIPTPGHNVGDKMIKPLGNRVLVEKVIVKASSAVLLPDNLYEKNSQCFVRDIGPDVKTIKIGDSVIYNKFGSAEVIDEDNPEAKYVIVAEPEIFAIKEKK
jgi:chaperonin GroES